MAKIVQSHVAILTTENIVRGTVIAQNRFVTSLRDVFHQTVSKFFFPYFKARISTSHCIFIGCVIFIFRSKVEKHYANKNDNNR